MFDLDGNGKPDQLIGRLWERWGRLQVSVQLAGQAQPHETGQSCLVCDHDTVLRWNGKQYE